MAANIASCPLPLTGRGASSSMHSTPRHGARLSQVHLQAVEDLLQLAHRVDINNGASVEASCKRTARLLESSPCFRPALQDGQPHGEETFQASSASLMEKFSERDLGNDGGPGQGVTAVTPAEAGRPCVMNIGRGCVGIPRTRDPSRSARVGGFQGKRHRRKSGGAIHEQAERGSSNGNEVVLDLGVGGCARPSWSQRSVEQALNRQHSHQPTKDEKQGEEAGVGTPKRGLQELGYPTGCPDTHAKMSKGSQPDRSSVVLKVPRLSLPLPGTRSTRIHTNIPTLPHWTFAALTEQYGESIYWGSIYFVNILRCLLQERVGCWGSEGG